MNIFLLSFLTVALFTFLVTLRPSVFPFLHMERLPKRIAVHYGQKERGFSFSCSAVLLSVFSLFFHANLHMFINAFFIFKIYKIVSKKKLNICYRKRLCREEVTLAVGSYVLVTFPSWQIKI